MVSQHGCIFIRHVCVYELVQKHRVLAAFEEQNTQSNCHQQSLKLCETITAGETPSEQTFVLQGVHKGNGGATGCCPQRG